jgi:hypothetical protein
MPLEVVITFFGGLFAIGSIILAGQWMHHRYSAGAGSQVSVDRLTEELDGLRDELGLVQEKLAGLEAHVHSAEGLVLLPHDGQGAGRRLPPEGGRAVAEPRPPR